MRQDGMDGMGSRSTEEEREECWVLGAPVRMGQPKKVKMARYRRQFVENTVPVGSERLG